MNILLTHTPQEREELFPDEQLAQLHQLGKVVCNPFSHHLSQLELYRLCPEADVIVSEWETGLERQYLMQNPRLKAFVRSGVEIRNVDFAACEEYGVQVLNTPGGFAVPVSEFTVAALLCLQKSIFPYCSALKEGKVLLPQRTPELLGKTIAVVGLGFIGMRVARLCKDLGMLPIGVDVAERETSFPCMALDEALIQADVVTLHVELNQRTKNLLSRERIGRMKKGALLINTARGALVDEEALYEALVEGRLAGAALDVFSEEAPAELAENKLVRLPNVLATPHIAGYSYEAHQRNAQACVEHLRRLTAR